MYVLIYTDTVNQPRFVQGTIAEINAWIHRAWLDEGIDRDDWSYSLPFDLLCIEDGCLTPVNDWEMSSIPQLTIS